MLYCCCRWTAPVHYAALILWTPSRLNLPHKSSSALPMSFNFTSSGCVLSRDFSETSWLTSHTFPHCVDSSGPCHWCYTILVYLDQHLSSVIRVHQVPTDISSADGFLLKWVEHCNKAPSPEFFVVSSYLVTASIQDRLMCCSQYVVKSYENCQKLWNVLSILCLYFSI